VSSKDKKARRAALRDFLIAIPGALERATASLGWLVIIVGIALAVLVLRAVAGPPHFPVEPPPGGHGDNPSGALYVRDLGRLPDGRHTFDLVYELVLRNQTARPFAIDSSDDNLALGDVVGSGDAIWLDHPGTLFGRPEPQSKDGVVWTEQKTNGQSHKGGLVGAYRPGMWKAHVAHYRVKARADQMVSVTIGYALHPEPRGWFSAKEEHFDADPEHQDEHHEEAQLGAVLRAHCALGVKIQNGEMRSLCGL
jgi:hypothetical protein